MNRLFYGDNLKVLRDSIASESVDLIYLDPPFNSAASYNVLFKAPSGEGSQAQIEAFEDTWHWNESAERAFDDVVTGPQSDASVMLRAMRTALGENDMMAYLAMMAVRLVELHRVLKPTGSLYLHCDPTASHYLKILLDSIFGPTNFQNEVVWKRSITKGDVRKKFGSNHDIILYYGNGEEPFFQNQYTEPTEEYIERFKLDDHDGRGPYRLAPLDSPNPRPNLTYDYKGYPPPQKGWRVSPELMARLDAEGRLNFPQSRTGRISRKHYLNEQAGPKIDDVWTDIVPLQAVGVERLGYPTQKPLALLERIISASSREGQTVLDPFCGCGTTVHAAQKLNRDWIGIDVTHLAISLIERRLNEAFPGIQYEVHGVPRDVAGARDLAERDKHEFQKWITATIGAQPYKGGKKGMDRGIDGYLHFRDVEKKPQFAIVSVKGGGIKSGDIRDLKGTMDREKAALGIFLTLNKPTREMEREAAATGFYETGGRKFPRLQILTAEEVLDNRRPQVPFGFTEGFKKAEREETEQKRLL